MAYQFRNILAQSGLSDGAVALIHDLMDHDNCWNQRNTIIRRLSIGAPWKNRGDVLDAYISFACRFTEANGALPYFGYFIERGTGQFQENYRLVKLQQEAA